MAHEASKTTATASPGVAAPGRRYGCVAETLLRLAQGKPDQPAYSFSLNSSFATETLTWGDLDHRARCVAMALRGCAKRDRVVVLLPAGLDFVTAFFGCFYAGGVVVPLAPPRGGHPDSGTLEAIESVVRQVRPAAVLTLETIHQAIKRVSPPGSLLEKANWIATDHLGPSALPDRAFATAPGDLACIQFTSGSTREPRGVMLSHGQLLENAGYIRKAFEVTSDSRGVLWLPPHHDMGLIGGVVVPAVSEIPVLLMSPTSFLRRPLKWLEGISRFRGTHSGGPNFAYELCVRHAENADLSGLELSCWKLAFTGAEAIRPETLDSFANRFAGCGFRRRFFMPCYGLAEATLMVTAGDSRQESETLAVDTAALQQGSVVRADPTRGPGTNLLACSGKPVGPGRVLIVEPATLVAQPEDCVGEIWVAGPCVSLGYWERPDETEGLLRAKTATGQGPFLRTGDLGFIRRGQLFVTGRLSGVMTVRGKNHHAEDIERTVEASSPLICPGYSAVFATDEREPRIVVLAVPRSGRVSNGPVDRAKIAAAVREAVSARHGLRCDEIIFLKSRNMPRTTSGKVQRHVCRSRYLAGELSSLEVFRDLPAGGQQLDSDSIEAFLVGRCAEALGSAPSSIDVSASFAALGLDSFDLVSIGAQTEEWLGVTLSTSLLFEYPTIKVLAQRLRRMRVESSPPWEDSPGERS